MNKNFNEVIKSENPILPKFNYSNFNNTNINVNNQNNMANELKEEKDNNLKLIDALMDKIIAVSFISTDQTVNYPIACMNTDNFSKLEGKLYLVYPNLKNPNIYFIANGNIINRSLTVEQNKIKNGDKIIICLN